MALGSARLMSTDAKTSVDLWAASTFGSAELPDARLNDRLVRIGAILAGHPTDSLPQACANIAEAKAAYRFIENERVQVALLQPAIVKATARACAGKTEILVVQDTTTFNYSTLNKTSGLGPIGDSGCKARGLLCHSALAIDTQGIPLGMLHQKVWARDPLERHKSERRTELSIEDKESRKWLDGIQGARAAFTHILPAHRPRLIHVMDREGDIHEVFQEIADSPDGAVIRCMRNRVTGHPLRYAHQAVRDAPLLGTTVVDVPRKPGHPKRKASVELRACRVRLTPDASKYPERKALELTLVEVWEAHPPADAIEPLHWLLWTTQTVTTCIEAQAVVALYKFRWRIEDVHFSLKSGCGIEKLQLETAERLEKLITLFTPVAVRIVTLREQARIQPDAPCTTVLSELEWRSLWTYLEKKRPAPTQAPPSLKQATLWIGRLGGHLGRKGDGMPGVRALWRGFRDLERFTRVFEACDTFG